MTARRALILDSNADRAEQAPGAPILGPAGRVIRLDFLANTTMPHAVWTALQWGRVALDIDNLGGWDSGNADVWTVPPGISHIVVNLSVVIAGSTAGNRRAIKCVKNGLDTNGYPIIRAQKISGIAMFISAQSGRLSVAPGDEIAGYAEQDTGGPLDVLANPATWMAIEAYA